MAWLLNLEVIAMIMEGTIIYKNLDLLGEILGGGVAWNACWPQKSSQEINGTALSLRGRPAGYQGIRQWVVNNSPLRRLAISWRFYVGVGGGLAP